MVSHEGMKAHLKAREFAGERLQKGRFPSARRTQQQGHAPLQGTKNASRDTTTTCIIGGGDVKWCFQRLRR